MLCSFPRFLSPCKYFFSKSTFRNILSEIPSECPDQALFVGPYQGPNCCKSYQQTTLVGIEFSVTEKLHLILFFCVYFSPVLLNCVVKQRRSYSKPQHRHVNLYMGLDARKPVFGMLRITQAQTSLCIRAVRSAPFLFAFWKVPYANLLQVKFQFSS